MNNRIKELRKSLKLSQESFGIQLGVTKSAVSRIELGAYKVTDTILKLICTEYSVNEDWLRTGEGSMLVEDDSTIITELANEYHLDELDKKIIEQYIKLGSEERKTIKNYIISVAGQFNQNEIAATTEGQTVAFDNNGDLQVGSRQREEVEAELDIFRQEMLDEKKVRMSLASHAQDIS